ncbi:MAG: hypothetical protein ACK5LM_03380 [Lactovum sp.]
MMIKETPLIKLVNYIYIYLLLSIFSFFLITLSFSILLIPVIVTNYKVLSLYEELEFDIYRQFIKSYFLVFKENLKQLRYSPLSLYLLLSLYALNYSFSLTLFIGNLFMTILALYIILFLSIISLELEKKLKLKEIYIYFVEQYKSKQKIDLLMLTSTYMMLLYLGYYRLFIACFMLLIVLSYKMLRKVKND